MHEGSSQALSLQPLLQQQHGLHLVLLQYTSGAAVRFCKRGAAVAGCLLVVVQGSLLQLQDVEEVHSGGAVCTALYAQVVCVLIIFV
jgi:hypothetical protein